MRYLNLSRKAMRKSCLHVEPVLGGFAVFEAVYYNGRGWFDRAELTAMNRMGITYYDEVEGTIIGKGEVDE